MEGKRRGGAGAFLASAPERAGMRRPIETHLATLWPPICRRADGLMANSWMNSVDCGPRRGFGPNHRRADGASRRRMADPRRAAGLQENGCRANR